jgi:fructose-bisphosphate aldolase class II
MSLVKMKELLEDAEKRGYAVGAFSVANMEMILGAVRAAEELSSPMILQVAQVRLPYSPLDIIIPMMVAAAKSCKVPVAVHLDHGTDLSCLEKALELGATSVMIDASSKPIEENIRITKEVRALADKYGATVEAEVGTLGKSEDGKGAGKAIYSDPDEVERLRSETGVDAIALSIGNAHGFYKEAPKLDFSVLKAARDKTNGLPLVLHGGSGISDDDFRRCIAGGIRKINVATATFSAVEEAAGAYCAGGGRDYFSLSAAMAEGAYKNIRRHMLVFGSDKKA